MADNKQTSTSTSTQIRNLYSEGMSYMNLRFFNTNLGINIYPFTGRDNNGRSIYDKNNYIATTVNFESAFALYQASNDVIEGKVKELDITIPCTSGANILFQCKTNQNNQPEVIMTVMKNNVNIPFKFAVLNQTIKNNNGQIEHTVSHIGLGAFMKTVEGYLNGINANRHLDKLTDDYVKLINGSQSNDNNQSNNNQQNNRNNNYRGNYNNNGGYKKGYNNNYKRQYNNNNGGGFPSPPSNNNWNNNNSQNLSSYEINN